LSREREEVRLRSGNFAETGMGMMEEGRWKLNDGRGKR
jgi:hypothetical protein